MVMEGSINFRDAEIKKLFRRFLFPTVLGMVFSAVFVITDGIFVGKGLGSDALAAVNLVAPLYMIATGVGLMFGMGGSVIASIHLARKKIKIARINVTQAVLAPGIFMLAASLLLIVFRRHVLAVLGTPPALMELADEYLFYFTLFLAPVALANILMFFVRLDDSPKFAMACNIIAALLNILLDYLFIFVFKWGMAGAAVATGIGIVVELVLMLAYMLWYGRVLRFVRIKTSLKSLLFTARNLGYMMRVGGSALLSELALACMMVVGNYTFIMHIGKDGVAAFSIACYIFPIIFMVYNGIIQSAQPIISYNHGAAEARRVHTAFVLALKSAVLFGLVFFITTCLFNRQLVGMFLRPDMPAYLLASQGLPYFAAGYVFFGVNVVTIGYYQSIERGRLAAVLTVLRGIVLMALCFLVLPLFLGTKGIWLSVPAAEIITIAIIAFRAFRKKCGKGRPVCPRAELFQVK